MTPSCEGGKVGRRFGACLQPVIRPANASERLLDGRLVYRIGCSKGKTTRYGFELHQAATQDVEVIRKTYVDMLVYNPAWSSIVISTAFVDWK